MVRQLVTPREGINLVSSLPHIAKEAFNRIGTANEAMHNQ
jgi:hypothetical protein